MPQRRGTTAGLITTAPKNESVAAFRKVSVRQWRRSETTRDHETPVRRLQARRPNLEREGDHGRCGREQQLRRLLQRERRHRRRRRRGRAARHVVVFVLRRLVMLRGQHRAAATVVVVVVRAKLRPLRAALRHEVEAAAVLGEDGVRAEHLAWRPRREWSCVRTMRVEHNAPNTSDQLSTGRCTLPTDHAPPPLPASSMSTGERV